MSLSSQTLLRAGAVALTLATASLASAPAQAQSTNFSFSFQSPEGFGFSIGKGEQSRQQHRGWDNRDRGNRWDHRGGRHWEQRQCLNSREVLRLVRANGYQNASIYADDGRQVRVRASQGYREYIVTVDTCRGWIVDRDRIRR